ncbi:apolipoprotein L6-like, partial [Acipenser oxyrinchus oxyrinchus]
QQDKDSVLDWWYTDEGWDDWSSDEGFTEEEEIKIMADIACQVYTGIRHFLKLFLERFDTLQKYVSELCVIADEVDKYHKKAVIANITGGAVSAAGGVATISGLILAPFTFGASIIVTAVGLGVATAGGVTSASATITDNVSNKLDRKKVEKIINGYQTEMKDISECLDFIKTGMEHMKSFDFSKMSEKVYNDMFPEMGDVFHTGASAGSNISEIVRMVQLAQVASATAVRVVSMASIVLSGLALGLDVFFIAKDSMELRKGAKTEFAAKIREVANELQSALLDLNKIKDELQKTIKEP